MVIKHCKVCENDHHGPFGARCVFTKAAKAKCVELGVSEEEFKLHLDFAKMEEYEDKDSNSDSDHKDEWIKDLVKINVDQRECIEKLVKRLDKMTVSTNTGSPFMSQINTPAPVGSGGGVMAPVAVTSPGNPFVQGPIVTRTGQPHLYPSTGLVTGVTTLGQAPPVYTSSTVGLGPMSSVTNVGGIVSGPTTSVYMTPHVPSTTTLGIAGQSYVPTTPTSQFRPMGQGGSSSPFYPSTMSQHYPHRPWLQPLPGSAGGAMNAPLTAAMDPSNYVTDVANSRAIKGIMLRPEYHVQHVINDGSLKSLNYKNMSYNDLVLGMCCVARFLLQSGGDISSYLSHMSFIARQAHLECFIDTTFVEYDRAVVDAVINGEISTFVAGYPLAQALSFHSANHKPSSQKGKNKVNQPKGNRPGSRLANEVCYNYNFRSCEGCARLHVCKQCRGNHKFSVCPTQDKQ